MRKSLTISLPENLKNDVDKITKEEGVTRSDIIRESLKDYIYFRKLQKLRDKLLIKAKKLGIYTDQNIFDQVS